MVLHAGQRINPIEGEAGTKRELFRVAGRIVQLNKLSGLFLDKIPGIDVMSIYPIVEDKQIGIVFGGFLP